MDEDVLTFFRAMGLGRLTRINAVLRTFMLGRSDPPRRAAEETGDDPAGEAVRSCPSLEDQAYSLRREILDHAAKVADAREGQGRDAELREKVKGLTALRDARLGR
ncbi:MAG: BrnA antitoxin family protein [Defluviimonas denitrificans]